MHTRSPLPHRLDVSSAAARPAHARRAFLKGAGALVAGSQVVPARLLGRDGGTPPSGQVTLAAIGTGGQGLQNV